MTRRWSTAQSPNSDTTSTSTCSRLHVRITRWPRSFPQYRPGHLRWLAATDAAAPPGLFLTGASYRGIGVPACIADAERTAAAVVDYLRR